jgi:hypothetical protein
MKQQKQTAAADARHRQKIEKLERTRLDALGQTLQAHHWLNEAVESANQVERSLITAEKLLRSREAKLHKASCALMDYVKK